MSDAVGDIGAALAGALGADRVKREAPLRTYTTFRVGGPADWLVETRSQNDLVRVVQIAHETRAPLTILGGGSNVLVADAGIRGIVVRPRAGEVRWQDESHVRADAAVTINGLVRWTIVHGASGVESWAGTPGTVGGAIFGNAHFDGRLIGDLVDSVCVVTRDGIVREVAGPDMGFGYDRSRLHASGEVVLSADFRVARGDAARLRAAARASLAFRKRTQPLDTPSAGCVFRNPERGRDQVPAGMPWSAGALVDRAGLKGARVGGAVVSGIHGNFIVNDGAATAHDIRALIEHCRRAVREQFGVELREEIVSLGDFSAESPAAASPGVV